MADDDVLEGCVCYLDIRCGESGEINSSKAFVEAIETLGGEVSKKWSSRITHCVFKAGKASTLSYCEHNENVKIVSPQWITECKRLGIRITESRYPAKLQTLPRKKEYEPKSLEGILEPEDPRFSSSQRAFGSDEPELPSSSGVPRLKETSKAKRRRSSRNGRGAKKKATMSPNKINATPTNLEEKRTLSKRRQSLRLKETPVVDTKNSNTMEDDLAYAMKLQLELDAESSEEELPIEQTMSPNTANSATKAPKAKTPKRSTDLPHSSRVTPKAPAISSNTSTASKKGEKKVTNRGKTQSQKKQKRVTKHSNTEPKLGSASNTMGAEKEIPMKDKKSDHSAKSQTKTTKRRRSLRRNQIDEIDSDLAFALKLQSEYDAEEEQEEQSSKKPRRSTGARSSESSKPANTGDHTPANRNRSKSKSSPNSAIKKAHDPDLALELTPQILSSSSSSDSSPNVRNYSQNNQNESSDEDIPLTKISKESRHSLDVAKTPQIQDVSSDEDLPLAKMSERGMHTGKNATKEDTGSVQSSKRKPSTSKRSKSKQASKKGATSKNIRKKAATNSNKKTTGPRADKKTGRDDKRRTLKGITNKRKSSSSLGSKNKKSKAEASSASFEKVFAISCCDEQCEDLFYDLGKTMKFRTTANLGACTHLISGGTRTLKVLFALAKGAWILKPSYLYAAVENQKLPSEKDYTHSDVFPGICKAGAEGQKLLHRQKVFVAPNQEEPPRKILIKLLHLCGATVSIRVSIDLQQMS